MRVGGRSKNFIKPVSKNKNMRRKRKNKIIIQTKKNGFVLTKEKIEDFLHSDSPSATATKFILMFLATGTVVFGGAVLPGIFKALESFNKKGKFSRREISSAITNIKRQKLIKILKDDNNKVSVLLSNKGKERIVEYSMDDLEIKKPAKWDGKWRILIFDIPTKPKIYNLAREALRGKIKDLGLRQIQKSVWAFPYECEDELLFVAEAFEVQKYIEIFTVEKVLHEKELKAMFNLK